MKMKNFGLIDFFRKNVLNLITSLLMTSALFASALVVSAWSAFTLIISAASATLATARPFVNKTLKALALLVTIQ